MKKLACALIFIMLSLCSFCVSYAYLVNKNKSEVLLSNPNSNEEVSNPIKDGQDDKSKNVAHNKVDNKTDNKIDNQVDNKSDSKIDNSPSKVVVNKTVEDKALFNKEVFLTFDDGPSTNTSKILKILDDNKIKATFFVIGSNVDEYPDLVKAEYKAGMTILNHSYSHNYSMYKSIDACMSDFSKCDEAIRKAIGSEPLKFIRFPGGSDNTVSQAKMMNNIRNEFIAKGMEYADWNIDSGDADKVKVPKATIENNIIRQFGSTNFAVALMHDAPAKTTTVDALPAIIDYLKKNGYVFRTFSDLTPTEEKEMKTKRIVDRGGN